MRPSRDPRYCQGTPRQLAASVAIGLVSAGFTRAVWLPVALALTGAMMLLAASLVLIAESRIALRTTLRELTTVREA